MHIDQFDGFFLGYIVGHRILRSFAWGGNCVLDTSSIGR